jgi:hypothetical protein
MQIGRSEYRVDYYWYLLLPTILAIAHIPADGRLNRLTALYLFLSRLPAGHRLLLFLYCHLAMFWQ